VPSTSKITARSRSTRSIDMSVRPRPRRAHQRRSEVQAPRIASWIGVELR
jgi:hypothetical protein